MATLLFHRFTANPFYNINLANTLTDGLIKDEVVPHCLGRPVLRTGCAELETEEAGDNGPGLGDSTCLQGSEAM